MPPQRLAGADLLPLRIHRRPKMHDSTRGTSWQSPFEKEGCIGRGYCASGVPAPIRIRVGTTHPESLMGRIFRRTADVNTASADLDQVARLTGELNAALEQQAAT